MPWNYIHYLIGKKFVNLKLASCSGAFTCLDYYIMLVTPEHQAYNHALSVISALILISTHLRIGVFSCMITMTMMVFAHHFSL